MGRDLEDDVSWFNPSSVVHIHKYYMALLYLLCSDRPPNINPKTPPTLRIEHVFTHQIQTQSQHSSPSAGQLVGSRAPERGPSVGGTCRRRPSV